MAETLEDKWRSFVETFELNDLDPKNLTTLRDTFFCGAAGCYRIMGDACREGVSEEELECISEDVLLELRWFFASKEYELYGKLRGISL